jgi:hypothetical protein
LENQWDDGNPCYVAKQAPPSPEEQIEDEVQDVDMALEVLGTFCGKVADNFQPLGEPNMQCQASFLSVPDFLLSVLDSGDVKSTMTELSALLASLAQLDWSASAASLELARLASSALKLDWSASASILNTGLQVRVLARTVSCGRSDP